MSEMREMDDRHPIYNAIDKGGGQTCDIAGVIRELNIAGYVIVPRKPTEAMIAAAMKPYTYGNDAAMNAAFRATIEGYWRAMIDEILK